ncbi:MAG: SMP-30/gluconolactonase/LRE family protein [Candidatus Neomarinimicrobiota bacterium]
MRFKTIIMFVPLLTAIPLPAQNYFVNPESVTFDAERSRYLVSNKGDGKIISLDLNGNQAIFSSSQSSVRGLQILSDRLYAACDAGVVAFNLATAAKVMTVAISERVFLNDITADGDGYLYISDSSSGKIFRVNSADQSWSTFVSGLASPNGLLFDAANNRLLVCHWGANAKISAVDLSNGSVSWVVSTPYSDLDGLAFDSQGSIYVSSWGSGVVYRYNNLFTMADAVSSGHAGPADIYISAEDVLAVPNFNGNSVDLINLIVISTGDPAAQLPRECQLLPNYPNPFNPQTVISYTLAEPTRVDLTVYDLRGQLVVNLLSADQQPGLHRLIWQADQFAAGTYFCRLRTGSGFDRTNKLVLIK